VALDLTSKRVAVFGLGKSGLSAVKLLVREGARVTCFDDKALGAMGETGRALEALGVTAVEAPSAKRLREHDLLVVSPGVPLARPEIQEARAAGLETFGEVILDSQAVLVTRGGEVPEEFEVFRRRIEGVLVARSYVMMDYDIEQANLDAATALAPGREGPTISPLGTEGWVAVRVMVPRAGSQKLMDDLWSIGARAILLTDIHACRL